MKNSMFSYKLNVERWIKVLWAIFFTIGIPTILWWDYSFSGLLTPIESKCMEELEVIEGTFYYKEGTTGDRSGSMDKYGIYDEESGTMTQLSQAIAVDGADWQSYEMQPVKAWVTDDPKSENTKLVYQLMIGERITFDINRANKEVEKANARGWHAALFVIVIYSAVVWGIIKVVH